MAEQCWYQRGDWRCPEEAISGGGLCIFHDPDLTKDVELLKTRFEARLANEKEDPLQLDGAIFPDEISFKGIVFSRSVSFSEARFHGQRISFAAAQFQGQQTSFGKAEFHGESSFYEAQFHSQEISFDGAQFLGQWTSFDRANFYGQSSFYEAQFHGQETSFAAAHFEGQQTSFGKAEFHGQQTSFGVAQFLGQEISFDGAQFLGQQTSFAEAQFRGQRTSFIGAQFHGQLSFDRAQFHGQRTSFDETTFLGQRTSFVEVEFHGQTSFFRAQFRGRETFFDGTKFHGELTYFVGAEFHSQETSFGGAQFHGEAIFEGKEPKGVFIGDEGRTVDFRRIHVSESGSVVFDWVDLSRTRLLHSDLSKVKFFDVTWDRPQVLRLGPLFGGWRSRVYDETLWRQARRDSNERGRVDAEYLPQLGRLYRMLKAYYRESGQHGLVGQFHYGLMEVQWHQKEVGASWVKRKLRKWVSWEAAYRYSSGYAEDYVWAGLTLGCLLVMFAGSYWLLGVPSDVHGAPWWKQGLHALLYSFQAGTLGRVDFYGRPPALAARYLHLAESVLVPVQFGFFLLALRNRFRR